MSNSATFRQGLAELEAAIRADRQQWIRDANAVKLLIKEAEGETFSYLGVERAGETGFTVRVRVNRSEQGPFGIVAIDPADKAELVRLNNDFEGVCEFKPEAR